MKINRGRDSAAPSNNKPGSVSLTHFPFWHVRKSLTILVYRDQVIRSTDEGRIPETGTLLVHNAIYRDLFTTLVYSQIKLLYILINKGFQRTKVNK